MATGKIVLVLLGVTLVVLTAIDLLSKEASLLMSNSVVHEESSVKSIVVPTSCAAIAPCWRPLHTKNSCFDVYPNEFWRRNKEMASSLHWQRLNSPRKWYENEYLAWTRHGDKDTNACPDAPETLVYFHNFKAGGTTAHEVLHYGLPGYDVKYEHYGDTERAKQFAKRSFDFAQQIYNMQQEHPNAVKAFTFVRNPVKRFLSGLAQIGRMNTLEETIDGESRKCFTLTGEGLSYLMDTWTNWGLLDIQVTIAHIDDMDAVFTSLLQGDHIQHARESNANGVHDKIELSAISDATIARICQAYRADLVLLQLMNFSDPLCPGDYSFDDEA